jgi:hypothetical protein
LREILPCSHGTGDVRKFQAIYILAKRSHT